MDSSQFAKLCKECCLVGECLLLSQVDLIFGKVADKARILPLCLRLGWHLAGWIVCKPRPLCPVVQPPPQLLLQCMGGAAWHGGLHFRWS
jgi:hypothetical protein